MSDTNIIEKIKGRFGSVVLEDHHFRGDQTVTLQKDKLVEVTQFLKDEPSINMDFLMDLTAVDYMDRKPQRFEVVYHFYSSKLNHRVRLKVPVDEDDCVVDTLDPLYKSANWFEREVWDLYGIKFKGPSQHETHIALRRVQGPSPAQGLSHQQTATVDRANELKFG